MSRSCIDEQELEPMWHKLLSSEYLSRALLIGMVSSVITACSEDLKITRIVNYEKYKNNGLGVDVLKVNSSTSQDGYYAEGSVIGIDLELSDMLTVDDPSLLSIPLVLGETTRQAYYNSGNEKAIFHFSYTVLAGDNSPRLQYAEGAILNVLPLEIGGKKLKQAEMQPRILGLPTTSSLSSLGALKKIVIDTTPPKQPTAVVFFSKPGGPGHDAKLSWTTSDDANFKDFEFKLCRSDDCDTACSEHQHVSSPEVVLSGFADGSYRACVRAWDLALNSSPWAASADAIELDATAPEAPAAIRFDNGKVYYGVSTAKISFDAVNAPDLDTYRVKRCQQADCASACGGEQELTKTSLYLPLEEGKPVFACVQAIDKAGNASHWTASLNSATSDTQPPQLELGAERRAGNSFVLSPSVSDTSPLSFAWSQVSGPGIISFESPNSRDTLINATVEGTYIFRLQVTDAVGNVVQADTTLVWDRSLALAIGRDDTCAIYARGLLRCWGRNLDGVHGMGDAAGKMRSSPPLGYINPGIGRSVLSAAIGASHICAILDDNSLKCWGDSGSGQLGYNATTRLTAPAAAAVAVGAGRSVTVVAAGSAHTCVVLDNGGVKCWGDNDFGQLGYGDTISRSLPPDATVDLGPGRSAKDLALTDLTTCAILDDGSVKCWGLNSYGQLGVGDKVPRTAPPIETLNFGAGLTVSKLSNGGRWSFCAILSDGSVKCWGYNAFGQLGDGTVAGRMVPTAVNASVGFPLQLALGPYHTCARYTGGIVKCWGSLTEGELGLGLSATPSTKCSDGVSTPSEVCTAAGGVWNSSSGFSDCSNGIDNSAAACTAGGGTWAHCSDFTKDIAGLCTGSLTWNPSLYNYCTKPNSSSAALCTSMGGSKGSHGYCSGISFFTKAACLAAGHSWNVATLPGKAVDFGAGRTALAVRSGSSGRLSCALLDDFSVKCWGDNTYGQLGYGDAEMYMQFSDPLDFGLGNTVQKLVMGSSSSCALLADGSVKCWGQGNSGRLGTGSEMNLRTPPSSAIALGGAAIDISLFANHACAVLSDGTVSCWGVGTNGALGNGLTSSIASPVNVGGLAGSAVAVATSRGHSCALLTDGKVQCWGSMINGNLGFGGTAGASTYCSDGMTAQASCTTPLVYSGNLFGDCSNGISTRQAVCLAASDGAWGSCSNGISVTELACTSAGNAWNSSLYSYCTHSNGTTTSSVFCANTGGVLGAYGYCSNASYRTKSSCFAAGATWHVYTRAGPAIDFAGVAAKAIVALNTSTCAHLVNDTVRCWGKNDYGLIGVGDATATIYPSPAQAIDFGGRSVKKLTAGMHSACAILDDDSLRCWGSNDDNQLGYLDSKDNVTAPKPVSADFGSRTVMTASMGGGENNAKCILAGDDKLYCMGSLGINFTNYPFESTAFVARMRMDTPIDLGTISKPVGVALAAKPTTICVTFADGTVRCAGNNGFGQLGVGTRGLHLAPEATTTINLGPLP